LGFVSFSPTYIDFFTPRASACLCGEMTHY
jgi:hypothetical protein